MKTTLPNTIPRQRGALMGVVLLMMLCTGLFLASWVTMMSTRAIQVSWLESAVQRRLSLENSRLLAWQTAMDHGFDPETDLKGQSSLLLDGAGGGLDTVSGWKDLATYSVLSTSTVTPYNQTGLRPGGSFFIPEKFVRPNISGEVNLDPFTSHLFLKSQCPALSGDLLVVYRKPERYVSNDILDIYRNTAPYRVEGRVVLRHPPSLFARTTSTVSLPMQARSLYIQSHDAAGRYPVTGTSLDGAKLLPSNLPVVPSSSGPQSTTETKLFDGYLNVTKNDSNPQNSLWHLMDADTTVPADKKAPQDVFIADMATTEPWYFKKYRSGENPLVLPPDYPRGYDVDNFKVLYVNLADPDLKYLRVVNTGVNPAMNQIIFVGQTSVNSFEAAGKLPPVTVTIINEGSDYCVNLGFLHENNRRVILAVKDALKESQKGRALNFTWSGDPLQGRELRWRMTFVNEGHDVLLLLHDKNSAYDIRWIGGVMTDWSFRRAVNTGVRTERLLFQTDTTTDATHQAMLPRDAWLESYFLPDQP
ncbi:hypothetical protein EI77_04221 [Prosthecobacter fusiformis]|uniref:Uncharacterized protein n=1 Tax=Prosthecobacter fusiformis TaxID=48464 RepID=A0A4R7RLJ2_9BACT|nr:hypothetical protein [Prosthecobacter fusiformis]TDU64333.1 hypothetical protein EI77_04221 [Prosthecobacter fusiformis]